MRGVYSPALVADSAVVVGAGGCVVPVCVVDINRKHIL